MPVATTPTISPARASFTSATVPFTAQSGYTTRLFYRRLGVSPAADAEATPSIAGASGTFTLSNLASSGQYLVWAVSSDGSGYLSLPSIKFLSLASADSVTQAVKAKWDSLPVLVEKAGPLYTAEVPEKFGSEDVEIPYTWLNVTNSFFEWTTESLYYEVTDLEFNTYISGLNLAEQAQEEFRQSFDWQTLSFSSPLTQTVSVFPTDASVVSEMSRYKEGSPVFRSRTCYHLVIERHLTP